MCSFFCYCPQKQFYRPDFVLSHFVHYSTVTVSNSLVIHTISILFPDRQVKTHLFLGLPWVQTDLATEKQHTKGKFARDMTTNSETERFVDESEEGVLIHAKTTVPAETFSRDKMCKLNAPSHCMVGIPCPDHLPFSDELHTKNVFHNEKGEFCNCWMNRKVEEYWLPKLNDALSKVGTGL